jgi:hypothetical protein
VSSSIANQDPRSTEAKENYALDHCNGFLHGSFTTCMASTHLDT